MGVSTINTERLMIIPMTYSMINTVINGNYALLEDKGIKVNSKWPRQDTLDILNFLKGIMQINVDISGFDIWMIVKKDDMCVIGDAGFKGNPDENGNVEIGYGLIDEEQRKGYGYEVVSSLINWASKQKDVKVIMADCLIDNIGSIKILLKCGMQEVRRDDENIYWEKKV